jgi:hypothetical protein
MTLPNLRPLGFGEILDGAFTLYRRNFPLFLGTSLLVMLGILVAAFILGVTGAGMASATPGPIGFLATVLVVAAIASIAMVLYGALTWQAAQSYQGRPVSVNDGVEAGGRSAITLVAAAFIVLLAFGTMLFVLALVTMLLMAVVAAIGIPGVALVLVLVLVLGFFASLFFVAALFFGVLPAVVLEEKNAVDAVSRSVQLARGALPRVAGVMAVSLLITYLPMAAVMAFMGRFARAMDPVAAQAAGNTAAELLENLLTAGVGLLTTPFLVSVMVMLYFDRRVRTEALDVQILTDQLGLAGSGGAGLRPSVG